MTSIILQAIKKRRTHYALGKQVLVSDDQISDLVNEAVLHTPSAFNSQSGRVVVLLHNNHDQIWQIVRDALKAVVPVDQFAATDEKIDGFAAAYGTILFFDDTSTVKGLQAQFPAYASNFPIWAQQANGMLQSNVWTALSEHGLGASLQHYTELIEDQVRAAWQIPADWKLIGQMPFGHPLSQPGEKAYLPLEDRVRLYA